ncbi:uncharacterized protein LOC112685072 isoform X2 [Sipha flava]|uniref:Uncharacterized protein LOC112685072 isoform X2 n=1 Tax=Sipha flava TaxID=143950 RepID=A0A8B8FQK0_9HEMI|nr:uncharacterized protein LOC112685072 isoform X2 [Sipha flava]
MAKTSWDLIRRFIIFTGVLLPPWMRCSNKRPKSDKKNKKPNKNKRKKPIISAPFPADPDRLEGDKWRYVILTRLDTESPPERPPRTKRHRLQASATVGRRSSAQRRRRSSCGRGSGRRPPRLGRRAAGHCGRQQEQPLSADQLTDLVLRVYRHGRDRGTAEWQRNGAAVPEARDEVDSGGPRDRLAESGTAECERVLPVMAVERPTSPWAWWLCPATEGCKGPFDRPIVCHRYRQNGFFGSVGRARAMADGLLSL